MRKEIKKKKKLKTERKKDRKKDPFLLPTAKKRKSTQKE